MVVVDRDLGDAETRVLDLFHEFDADYATVRLEMHHIKDAASNKTEIAIDVAQLEAEAEGDHVVIDLADDLAVDRIVAVNLEAVDHVDLIAKGLTQHRELTRVVLRIAVGIENQILGRVGE